MVHIIVVVVAFLFVVVFAPLFTLALPPSTECFVDVNNGVDTDTCGNEETPCKSIRKCMNYSNPNLPTLPPFTYLYPGKYVGAENNCRLFVQNSTSTVKARIPNSYVEIDCQAFEGEYNYFIGTSYSSLRVEGLIISNTNSGIQINFDDGEGGNTNTFSEIVNCTIKGARESSVYLVYGSLSIINSTIIDSGYFISFGPNIFISNLNYINNRNIAPYNVANFSVISSTFISNTPFVPAGTTNHGGALDIMRTSAYWFTNVQIENCIFDGNYANYGGAIYKNFPGNLNITSTVFLNNKALSLGSVLYLTLQDETQWLFLNNVTFVDNSAPQPQQGGTIYLWSYGDVQVNPFTWNNVLLERNLGGGIVLEGFALYAADFTITGVTLSNSNPNLQCVDSPNLTFCESECVAKTCDACPGTCDITENDELPICHNFDSLSCPPQSYCVYSNEVPKCIDDGMHKEKIAVS